jgi:para-nitrobenzyl esterase
MEMQLNMRNALVRARLHSSTPMAVMAAAGLLGAGLYAAAARAETKAAAPVVQTDKGAVQGTAAGGGLDIFLGIPYAKAPVGDLRWRPPVAHGAWSGVVQATTYGPNCAEITTLGVFSGPANANEDCLYINVYTPGLGGTTAKSLPVIFWSYGGGEVDGESNDYNGRKLALAGPAVVVTFNYRLNLFGFLSHPALDGEGHIFSNYGLLDNQFALKWVRSNIAAFGGDPQNVTIVGQSAGSRNTASEVLSPLAAGLFAHAIYESGAQPNLVPLSVAETRGVAFAQAAGCGSGTDAAAAACLRALPAANVLSLAGTTSTNSAYITGPTLDGTMFTDYAIPAYEKGHFNHVPILDGDVENEGNFQLDIDEYFENPQARLTETQFVQYVTGAYSGNAGPGGLPPAYPKNTVARILKEYPLASYPSPQLQWSAATTDANYSCFTHHVNVILAPQVPLYVYEFRDQTAPDYFPKLPGFVSLAYHTSDIQYYWPLYHGGPLGHKHPLDTAQEILSEQLVTAWTNFATSGDPNRPKRIPGLASQWPQNTGGAKGLILSEDIAPAGITTFTNQEWSLEHHCGLWDSVLVYNPQP